MKVFIIGNKVITPMGDGVIRVIGFTVNDALLFTVELDDTQEYIELFKQHITLDEG